MASRELKVEIIGDASSLERAFGRASKSGGGLGRTLTTLGKVAAVGVGAAFVGLGIVVKKGFDELAEGEQVAAQTAARLKSTGDAAHVTAKQVGELAVAQSKLTGIDDEAIQAGENMLLTFTNIRNEIGKNNDIFNQATVAVEDMATAMNDGAIPSGEQLSTTAIRIGKALNDPIKGVTALSRVGVQFTADQKKQIEAMVKAGDTMGAQKLILAELTKEFGGSAKAAGETFPGQLAKLRNAFDDASSKVAVVFLPALTKLLGFITDRLIPGMGKAADFVRDFWQGISKRFANAPDFRAKIRVVFLGVADLARQFIDALFSQISGLLPQKPLILQPQTKVAVGGGGVDWEAVAADMVAALALALEQSVALAKALAELVRKSIDQVDWPDLGKSMGPGFATMLAVAFTTILDPAFWVKNWELTLSIALVVFGGAVGAWAAKIGVRLSVALLGSVAKISPEFAAALGRLMDDAGKVALAVFDRVGASLLKLATAVFGRLTKAAVFVIKVLGVQAAISAINDFVRAAIGKFKELLDWLSRLPGKIQGYFADAGTWLVDAGAAIVGGLWSGVASLWDSFISWLKSKIPDIPGIFRKFLGIGSPSKVMAEQVGKPIAEGIADGIEQNKTKMAEAAAKAAKEAVSKARQAVLDARGEFASAFADLADVAMQAFDAVAAQWQSRAGKRLAQMQLQDQIRASKEAIADAQRELQAARAARAAGGEDPTALQQAVVDAEKRLWEARRAERERQLALDDQKAQAVHEKDVARDRIHFQNRLERLQGELARFTKSGGELTAGEAKKYRAHLNDLLKDFGIDAKFWGTAIGISLANGLEQAQGAVRKAAFKLARMIQAALKTSSPAEEGPMSDLDTWWSDLVPTLLKSIDYEAVRRAGAGIAGALGQGARSTQTVGFGSSLIDWVRGVRTGTDTAITAFSETAAAKDALGQNFKEFSADTVAATDAVSTSVHRLASEQLFTGSVVKRELTSAWKVVSPVLGDLKLGFDLWASAINNVRGSLYALRNAVRDTQSEITGGTGQSVWTMLRGRAGGGPVRRGQPYIVGEAGPELFIPSAAGSIATASSAARMAGGTTTVEVNVYGDVTGEEIVRKVREGLLRVDLYNPGSAIARS